MAAMESEESGLDVDLKSLSAEGLVELIQQLEGSRFVRGWAACEPCKALRRRFAGLTIISS